MAAEIQALGYLGLEVSELKRWCDFATQTLGLQAVNKSKTRFDLRMDDYAARIHLREGPADDLIYAGWEVSDQRHLEELAARLERSGVTTALVGGDGANARNVAGLLRFSDPEGNIHEAFHGPLLKRDVPFVSPIGVQFKTGRQGLGHIVLSCRDREKMTDFFVNVLGFRVSDYINTEIIPGRPLQISFLRCNSRHHSLALAPAPIPKKIVHLMVEVASFDDVGRAMYRCLADNVHLSFTLGRHSNDSMLSFYPMSPSGFDIEYGCGGLKVDDESWRVAVHDTNSAWGHIFQRPPRTASAKDRT